MAADKVHPLQMKYKWGPHKRITSEAFRAAQPCGKIHQGVCAGRSKLLCLQARDEMKYESRRLGLSKRFMTSKGFFWFFYDGLKQRVLLSKTCDLATLLIDFYLISYHWDIKVVRASILPLSG